MKKKHATRSRHAALKTTALLVALLASEQGMADTPVAPGVPVNGREDVMLTDQELMLTDREQYRRHVLEQASAGSPQLALEEARKRPDAFSVSDTLQIEALGVVTEVRWGRQQALASNDADRLAQTELALRHIDDMLARIPPGDDHADLRRTMLAERVAALQGLGRMNEAIPLYEELSRGSEPLSAHTLAAAGEAYTYMDRPREAARAFELALQTPREPLQPSMEPHALKRIDVQEGLFFAYLDRGQYEAAQKLLEVVAKSTPMYADLAEHPEDLNEDYGRVKKMKAQYLLYTNRTREGVAALDELHRDAPFDPSLISARSDASLVQQRPHAAQAIYAGALVDHPGDIEMLAGLGKTALELNQYDRAAEVNAAFGDLFPESNAVRKFDREFGAYRNPQLIVAGNGQKGNSVLADNDWGIDTQLYSTPIAQYWRVFAHQYSGRANTGDGLSVSRIRNGVGGDFRYYGWDVAAEVNHSTGGQARTGAVATAAFEPDDHWKFSTGIDTNDNALPWKAYQEGVTGRTAGAGVRYRFDDYRYFDVGYGISRYNDTNLHQQWKATWYERVFQTPTQEVSLWAEFDTNGNTLTTAQYFNPHRDYTAQLTAMYQWTPWREVDKSFSQRVYGTFGGYRQTDIGNSGLWEVRLEQQWQLGPKAAIAYGLGISSQRQDRTRTTSKLIYLNLNVPL